MLHSNHDLQENAINFNHIAIVVKVFAINKNVSAYVVLEQLQDTSKRRTHKKIRHEKSVHAWLDVGSLFRGGKTP